MLKISELAMPKSRKVTTVCNGKREVWTDYGNCPNQVLLCGVAFCPYTSYSVGSQALQKTFTYISKSGHTTKVTTGVNWVGNALFGDFPTSMNNFAMLYTDYGQSGGGGTVYNGALGEAWKILNYDIN